LKANLLVFNVVFNFFVASDTSLVVTPALPALLTPALEVLAAKFDRLNKFNHSI
jgi:hypothetical protein